MAFALDLRKDGWMQNGKAGVQAVRGEFGAIDIGLLRRHTAARNSEGDRPLNAEANG